MVVNGQSVFLFRKPPRLRASFRIANAILHFRVIQPSESSPVKITSPVATSILPLRLDESMHQQKNKPSHRDTLSVWICIFELVSHYRVTGSCSTVHDTSRIFRPIQKHYAFIWSICETLLRCAIIQSTPFLHSSTTIVYIGLPHAHRDVIIALFQ